MTTAKETPNAINPIPKLNSCGVTVKIIRKSFRNRSPFNHFQRGHDKEESRWEDPVVVSIQKENQWGTGNGNLPDNITLEKQIRHGTDVNVVDLANLRQLQCRRCPCE